MIQHDEVHKQNKLPKKVSNLGRLWRKMSWEMKVSAHCALKGISPHY